MAMTETQLQEILETEEDFPALSQLPAKIVRLTSQLSAPVNEIAELLRADEALLGKMLGVINSPFYRFTDEISDIEQAISLVGYRKICNLAVGLSLLEQFPPEKTRLFDYRQFWERALCTAVAAGEISTHLHEDLKEETFTLGLLQDIGNLALSHACPIEYGQAIGLARGGEEHIVHAEREILVIDHAQAGAVLCKYWKLPSRLTQVVQNHHFSEFDEPVPMDLKSTIHVANLSNLIADVFYEHDPDRRKEILYERAESFFFRFGSGLVDQLLEKVPDHLQNIGSVLSVPIGDPAEAEIKPPSPYLETCPNCGASGTGKFCNECGDSLEKKPEHPPLDTNKILIAEDSAATRFALSILIKKLGYSPIEAINGADALRLARKERPGMILMDIQMPRMSGIEALKIIRREKGTSHIPVVMLTSITHANTVIEALESGANDYVVKPFTAAIIQDRVSKHMTRGD